jgi:SdrD B-like protein
MSWSLSFNGLRRNKNAASRATRSRRSSRKLALQAETLEGRLLLSFGEFLQGTVYNDVNFSGQLDSGDAPHTGVTIQLYAQDGTTLLSTTTTDTNGNYFFDDSNVVGGLQAYTTYRIVDVTPINFTNSQAWALATLDNATVLTPGSIEVTLAPASQTVTLTSLATGTVEGLFIDGAPRPEWFGQLGLSSGPMSNGGVANFLSNCVDLFNDVGSAPFTAVTQPASTALLGPNAGAIAYLYNHYDQAPLPTVQAEGLQLAIWKLEYDTTTDFSAGRITLPTSSSPAIPYDPNVVPAATAFMNEALGKHENAMVLNATLGDPPTGQSMLAGRSFNFLNVDPSTSLGAGDTATIGYWAGKNGQSIILSLNGGPNSHALANWLSTNFPALFPSAAIGSTNKSVASYFLSLKNSKTTPKLEAQIMATAFSVYVTNSNLAGTTAAAYGFNVTATGSGGTTINVGTNGWELGLTNNTDYSLLTILQAANANAVNGKLFATDSTARNAANVLFTNINVAGDLL